MNTGAAAAAASGARAPPLKRPREDGDGAARRRGRGPAGPVVNEESDPEEEDDEEFKPGSSVKEEEEEEEAAAEEARFSVGTLIKLRQMSKIELNGARAKVAPLPSGASANPDRMHVKLLTVVAGYVVGSILSVPARKMVWAGHGSSTRPKTEEEEDEDFRPGFSEEEEEEEEVGPSGGAAEEEEAAREEEEARFSVGTLVTLQRMSKIELNGAHAKVAPVPRGASAKPGRTYVELLTPVDGYDEGATLSVSVDKLVRATQRILARTRIGQGVAHSSHMQGLGLGWVARSSLP
jgi:hypothetical protein